MSHTGAQSCQSGAWYTIRRRLSVSSVFIVGLIAYNLLSGLADLEGLLQGARIVAARVHRRADSMEWCQRASGLASLAHTLSEATMDV